MKRYIVNFGLLLSLLLLVGMFLLGGTRGQAYAENEAWAENWDAADIYGPSEGLQLVEGNALISAAGAELRNTVIIGDLQLQTEDGDGEITLHNVTVTGELKVLGAGTVIIKDGQINRLYVQNEERAVTVVAEGSAAVWQVRLASECLLEEKTGEEQIGFGHVYSTTSETITLSGNFPTLTVENTGGAVNFLSGRIGKIYIESKANDSILTLGEHTEIDVIDLASAVRIKGKGKIKLAVVLANGTEMDMDAEAYEFAEGTFVLVDGGVVDINGKREVTLQPFEDLTLNPGKSAVKKVVVDPADAEVTVSSNNTAVATATLSGDTINIKALSPGRATITVTAVKEGHSTARATFTVTVNTPELPKITISGISSFTLNPGGSTSRNFTVNPSDAEVTVSSSNPAVATATLSGKSIHITAKAAGTTTITLRATKAGYAAAGTSFKVTVKAPTQAPQVGVGDIKVVENSPIPAAVGIRIYLKNTNNPGNYIVTLNGNATKFNAGGGYFEYAEPMNQANLAKKSKAELMGLVKIQPKSK